MKKYGKNMNMNYFRITGSIGLCILFMVFLSMNIFGAESKVSMDVSSTYLLGIEDVIQLSVWEHLEFTARIPIRPDGKISVELIGDVDAAGLTPVELAAVTQAKLAEYVKNPRVTITVAEFKSKKVIVNGEVRRPGAVIIKGSLTALEAVVEAGSPTRFANLKKAAVVRGDPNNPQIIPLNLDSIINKGESQLDVYLQDGDVVVVPPKNSVKLGYAMEALFMPFRAVFGLGGLIAAAATNN